VLDLSIWEQFEIAADIISQCRGKTDYFHFSYNCRAPKLIEAATCSSAEVQCSSHFSKEEKNVFSD